MSSDRDLATELVAVLTQMDPLSPLHQPGDPKLYRDDDDNKGSLTDRQTPLVTVSRRRVGWG